MLVQIEFVARGQVIGFLGPSGAVSDSSKATRFAPTVAEVKTHLDRAMSLLPDLSPHPVSIYVEKAEE